MTKPTLSSKELAILNYQLEARRAIFDRINNIHKRPLHEGQIQMSKAFFEDKKRVIFSQWGRSGAKTESNIFIATTFAILNPFTETYIVCPQIKQAKKIYWLPKRLQNYAPPQYLDGAPRESELRLCFTNGSTVILDGCENYEALRGIKPHLVIYDEFQDHSKEFDEEVMQPTLMGRGASLIVTGTPPKSRDAYFVEFRQRLLDEIASGDNTRMYLELPSWMNPSLDRAELEKKKIALFKSGDEAVWYREYEGKLIFGGEGSVFPSWEPKKHVLRHDIIMPLLERDKSKLKWITACDPGTNSCFAVLFCAYNPYTSQLYVLDEIYEKDRKLTDSKSIWERIKLKEQALYPGHPPRTFKRVYDEAAAWFAREISANYGEGMVPTHKAHRSIDQDISLIKTMMAEDGLIYISDRCHWLRWEIESYVTDEKGELPEKNDHLLDCLRYGMNLVNCKIIERADSKQVIDVRTEAAFLKHNKVMIQKESMNEDWTETVMDASLTLNWGEYDA